MILNAQEIRDAAKIEDIVGQFVKLKRAGVNLVGLSPFTDEKNAVVYRFPEEQ